MHPEPHPIRTLRELLLECQRFVQDHDSAAVASAYGTRIHHQQERDRWARYATAVEQQLLIEESHNLYRMVRSLDANAPTVKPHVITRDDRDLHLHWEVAPDQLTPDDWRVEAIDHQGEGECYVTIFSGPDAEDRARDYAVWMNQEEAKKP
jgi:hypothetical protein